MAGIERNLHTIHDELQEEGENIAKHFNATGYGGGLAVAGTVGSGRQDYSTRDRFNVAEPQLAARQGTPYTGPDFSRMPSL